VNDGLGGGMEGADDNVKGHPKDEEPAGPIFAAESEDRADDGKEANEQDEKLIGFRSGGWFDFGRVVNEANGAGNQKQRAD